MMFDERDDMMAEAGAHTYRRRADDDDYKHNVDGVLVSNDLPAGRCCGGAPGAQWQEGS